MTGVPLAGSSPLHNGTVVLCALFVPLSFLFVAVLEAGFDAVNPAGLDVTLGPSYLRERLGFEFGFSAVLIVVIAAMILGIYRRERRFAAIALPLIVLGSGMVVGLLVLLVNGMVDGIEAAYLGQP